MIAVGVFANVQPIQNGYSKTRSGLAVKNTKANNYKQSISGQAKRKNISDSPWLHNLKSSEKLESCVIQADNCQEPIVLSEQYIHRSFKKQT